MKKTFKGFLALAFCVATIFATMVFASAVSAPKAKVKTVTYNTVTISWAEIKDADGGYEIQRSTNSKKGWKTIATAKKGATSYKDSKLTTGTTYYYRVRSIDKTLFGKKYSDYSSTVKAKPVPAKVTGLKSSVTHNSVKLTWSKVSGASGYEVQVYSSKKWKSYKTTSKNTLTISKLKLGTTYQYRVRAYKTVSKKKIYGDVSSSIKATPTLKAPSSLVLKGVTSSTLTLSWSAVDGAKGYEVYNANTKKWTDTKTKRTLTVKKLKAGTKYSFLVRAYSGKVDGAKTKTLSFYTSPSAPTGLKLKKATTTSLELTWSKTTGASGYQVQYSTDKKKWTNLSGTSKTTNTIKSLSSGKTYYVRVRAYVKNSNVKDISATSYGSYSSILTAYTNVTAPKTVKLTGVTTTSLSLSWSSSTGAKSYQVQYSTDNKNWTSLTSTTKTAATITNLKSGTKYTIKVKAVGANKTAVTSSSVSFKTTPSKVTGITISDITADSFKASWSKVTGADGYAVFIYDYSTKRESIANSTTSTSYTFEELKANSKYKITIKAYVKNSNNVSYADYDWVDNITTYALNTIGVSWSKVSGANKYVVERFNPTTHSWDELTTTSALYCRDDSHEDTNVAALYRITAYKDSKKLSSVQKEFSNSGIKISKATNTMTVSWIKPSFDSTSESRRVPIFYSVFELPRAGSTETQEKLVDIIGPDDTEHTFFTAYGTEQTYVIYAHNDYLSTAVKAQLISNTSRRKQVAKFTVRAENFVIDETDASKTGQLLMLTDAINRTKYEQGTINITRDSVTSFAIDEIGMEGPTLQLQTILPILPGLYDFADSKVFPKKVSATGTEQVLKFMNAMEDEGSTITREEVEKTEKIAQDVTYNKGTCLTELEKTVLLHEYIEPCLEEVPHTAYLYNATKASAWKDGFSSVSTTKKENGNYVITATIKAEKFGTSINIPQTFYHNGFNSSLAALDISAVDGMENTLTNISATNISAEINSNGQLVNYSFSETSMTSNYKMSMAEETGGLFDIEVKLKINLSSAFKYNFTYGVQ